MLRPTEDEPGKADLNGRTSPNWRGSVQAKLTDEQWLELILPIRLCTIHWEKYIDTAAGFHKQLQDANVPVPWAVPARKQRNLDSPLPPSRHTSLEVPGGTR